MSRYQPPEDEETSGDESSDGRTVGAERSFERVNQLSLWEKAIVVVTTAAAGGTVAYLAFGQLVPDSDFAEVVAGWLRDIGINARAFFYEVDRFLDGLLQLTGGLHAAGTNAVLEAGAIASNGLASTGSALPDIVSSLL